MHYQQIANYILARVQGIINNDVVKLMSNYIGCLFKGKAVEKALDVFDVDRPYNGSSTTGQAENMLIDAGVFGPDRAISQQGIDKLIWSLHGLYEYVDLFYYQYNGSPCHDPVLGEIDELIHNLANLRDIVSPADERPDDENPPKKRRIN